MNLRRVAVVAGTTVLDLIVRLIAGAPALRSGSTVSVAAVVVVSLLAGLAAWGLLALLEHRSANGRRTWRVIAVVVLVVSLLGPLSGVSAADKITLLVLHLVTGLSLIVLLPGSIRRSHVDHGVATTVS